MQKVYHPDQVLKHLTKYNYDLGNDEYLEV
jgi:hypothetical protein